MGLIAVVDEVDCNGFLVEIPDDNEKFWEVFDENPRKAIFEYGRPVKKIDSTLMFKPHENVKDNALFLQLEECLEKGDGGKFDERNENITEKPIYGVVELAAGIREGGVNPVFTVFEIGKGYVEAQQPASWWNPALLAFKNIEEIRKAENGEIDIDERERVVAIPKSDVGYGQLYKDVIEENVAKWVKPSKSNNDFEFKD